MNTQEINQPQAEGLWNTIKSKFQINSIIEYIKESKESLLEFALYAGIGFLMGLLIKRFTTLFICLVLFIAAAIILNQTGIITFNNNKLYQLFGIQHPLGSSENIVIMMWEWVKINWLLTVGFTLGFLLGLKFA